ncbi:MAG: L-lactate dehydrogenase [Xanthobacteraceae bacterium]|uniref:alpha-hydroxy acid oxidase n=1 Tax=Pseudolabrys sp. TaxID=1960880 RepID=UPI003D14566E
MAAITNVEDLRTLARRKIPKALFDYVDRGSYDELTYGTNRSDLKAIRFRQRVLIDADNRSLSTTMLGETVSMPVAIAPTGLTGLLHGNGEMVAARAAEKAGIRFTLSTMSICSIEDVRSATTQPFWFQLYVFRDRGFSEEVIARAHRAGCTALFVTVDLPLRGQRHADIKNGLQVPPRLTMRNAFDIATKPGWAMSVLMGKRKSFGNIDAYLKRKGGVWAAGRWANDNFDASMSWRDVEWVRKLWPGKLVLKGILDPADAQMAADLGADAIVVSNHGGRQLDGAPSTIVALPKIAEAAGHRLEVLFDGGVRSGQDVLKALALGARGCMIGRAYLYGLAAMGEAGVAKALSMIGDELRVSMSLTGVQNIGEVTRDILFDRDADRRSNI